MIDCSHANSNKDANLQPLVMHDVCNQILDGNKSIVGLMVESNLNFGNQSIPSDLSELKYSVIALGDTSYDTYNQAGRNIDALLSQKGAIKVAERLELNILDEALPEDTALAWLDSWITKTGLK